MDKTLETKVKECIIDRLDLQMSAEEILDDAPLFGEGLGLDSLDSLELVIAIGKNFDVEINDDEYHVLSTVESICEFIREKTLERI
ncbi:phosphopantetheine-binding protein [Metabacillus halosaccharovorans]|uniref:phosphopantetheine-binding protein n=1 Tax=Bacillaceae TaxID=186817 RepID=UPI0004B923C9|nr:MULTISPECIES: phosphopantetheine-binding protein [Bacillaceae]MCM3440399.1 phosphopantetheine-binding protein [Metabacillus halosaccharovorans]